MSNKPPKSIKPARSHQFAIIIPFPAPPACSSKAAQAAKASQRPLKAFSASALIYPLIWYQKASQRPNIALKSNLSQSLPQSLQPETQHDE